MTKAQTAKETKSARNRRYYQARKQRLAMAEDAAKASRGRISDSVLSRARAKIADAAQTKNPFKPYEPAPGVVPKDSAIMAMDQTIVAVGGWAAGPYNGAFAEGQVFLGYPELSILAQRPEYRVMSETIATEMTREWIEFTYAGEGDATEKLKAIETAFKRLGVQDAFRKIAELDGFFGRAHLYLDTGATDDRDELQTPIGDGRNSVSKAKVGKGSLKRLKPVEPVWCYPADYNSNDPLKPSWYRPDSWFVQGKQVHSSRLLTFIGREVPDLLKPAYSFGGLSLSQMAKPYVDNWLRTRQSVADIVSAFSVFVLMTNLSESMQADGDQLFRRADLFNNLRDNRGLMMLDKDSEDFKNVSASLAGLHELQAQAQEHQAAVCKIPLVKLTGISPSGLNASSDGELRCFYDAIHAGQEMFFRPNLTKVLGFVQLSEFGEVDPNIDFKFRPLYQLSEKERAEMRKIEAETGQILVDTGVISQEEERQRVAGDPETPYAGLDPDEMPDLLDEEESGLAPRGGHMLKNLGEEDGPENTLNRLFDKSKAENDRDQAGRAASGARSGEAGREGRTAERLEKA